MNENIDDYLRLTLLIIAPLTLAIVIVSLFSYGKLSKEALRRTVSLHSSDGLAKQGLFWIVILAPTFYFLGFGYFAWRDYQPSLTAHGFKNFVSISAIPLGLLSISIPLTALVARLHSTSQAARQIHLSEVKNNYDLFYLHRREYIAFYQQIGERTFLDEFTVSFKINPRLHGRFFEGDASAGVPRLRTDYVERIITDLRLARRYLAVIISESQQDESFSFYIEFCSKIYYWIIELGITELRSSLGKCSLDIPYELDGKALYFRSVGTTTQEAVAAYRCVKSYLINTMEFAGYETGLNFLKEGEVRYVDITGDYNYIGADGFPIERLITDARKIESGKS